MEMANAQFHSACSAACALTVFSASSGRFAGRSSAPATHYYPEN
ncbi:MAG: hypothetical protein PUG34_04660 [Eubacteriales bacterium]|nr:hypothetical protein [Eubacteriales bacterium]